MPYTAKQRRYFHAQAEKGKPGMSRLAAEADSYAKAGKELPAKKGGGGGKAGRSNKQRAAGRAKKRKS